MQDHNFETGTIAADNRYAGFQPTTAKEFRKSIVPEVMWGRNEVPKAKLRLQPRDKATLSIGTASLVASD